MPKVFLLDRVGPLRQEWTIGHPKQQRERSMRHLSEKFGFDQLGDDLSAVLDEPEPFADTRGKRIKPGELRHSHRLPDDSLETGHVAGTVNWHQEESGLPSSWMPQPVGCLITGTFWTTRKDQREGRPAARPSGTRSADFGHGLEP